MTMEEHIFAMQTRQLLFFIPLSVFRLYKEAILLPFDGKKKLPLQLKYTKITSHVVNKQFLVPPEVGFGGLYGA